MDLIKLHWLANDLYSPTENKLCDEDASHNMTIDLPADSKKNVSNKTYTNLASLLGSYHLFWLRYSICFVIKSRRRKRGGQKNEQKLQESEIIMLKIEMIFSNVLKSKLCWFSSKKRLLAIITDQSTIESMLWELGSGFANAIQQQSF